MAQTNAAIKGQKQLATFGPETYVLTTVEHSASNGSTFDIDGTADSVVSARSRAGANPTATLGGASNGRKTVTLSGGASGPVEVITLHHQRPATFQPPESQSQGG